MTERLQRNQKRQSLVDSHKDESQRNGKTRSQVYGKLKLLFPYKAHVCVVRKDGNGNKQLVCLTRKQYLDSSLSIEMRI